MAKKSVMQEQKAFVQNLLDKGKTRAEATVEMAKKFDLKEGSAKAVVYRWFVGSDFAKKKGKAKAAKPKKAPVKKPAAKKATPKLHANKKNVSVQKSGSVQPKRSHHKKPDAAKAPAQKPVQKKSFFQRAVAEVVTPKEEKKPLPPKTNGAAVPAATPEKKKEVWEL